MAGVNRITMEIFRNLLSSIPEEMGAVLQRTGYSPNIKERRDFSCAIFDSKGDIAAQAAHLPVHLGSTPQSVKEAIRTVEMFPGDCVILNDPYRGGTHLPDITFVEPVFTPGGKEPSFYAANRAHHCDVGGKTPGSMGLCSHIKDEGLIIPPTKLIERGKLNRAVMGKIISELRNPHERKGDINAQIAANSVGRIRLLELVDKYSVETVLLQMEALQDHSERMVRELISRIPDGSYSAMDLMENDGRGSVNIPIALALTVHGDEIVMDFSGSAPQVRGSINAVRAVTLSAAFYALRCLVREDIPTNSGIFRPIRLVLPDSSIVNASYPAAVAGGNVETSQRIADVIFLAFSHAVSGKIPAASQGTMNNVTIGGLDPESGEEYTYYETIGGGTGGSSVGKGESAVHSHMTNTMNTPIEALERAYPLRVTKYLIRKGSGGKGRYEGGDGIIREYEFLGDAEVTILSERREMGPWGLEGGEDGKTGRNILIRDEREEIFPSKVHLNLKKGDRLRIETPGGGGYGRPGDERVQKNLGFSQE